MTDLQAVLFDMDGTLCDTEPAWLAAEFALATKYGGQWTHEDGLRLVGSDLLVSGAYIQHRMGLPLSPEQIVTELVAAVTASVTAEGVTWRPGAVELLAECNAASMPTALVTMSYRDLVGAVMAALPAGRFDAVVTGQDVLHGKPAPDAYLLAAASLGVAAASTIAIEDSAAGAASAEAAGCLVVAVPHHVDIPAGLRRVHRQSLARISLADLGALSAQR